MGLGLSSLHTSPSLHLHISRGDSGSIGTQLRVLVCPKGTALSVKPTGSGGGVIGF